MANYTKNNNAEIFDEIRDYFVDNPEIMAECMEALHLFNNCLSGYEIHDMGEIYEDLKDYDTRFIINALAFGIDDETSDDNCKYRFNIYRKYYYIDDYERIHSTNKKDYLIYADDYNLADMLNYREYITAIDNNPELAGLFDSLFIDFGID